jgi:ATP-binding protein involved in chromosome partitioning
VKRLAPAGTGRRQFGVPADRVVAVASGKGGVGKSTVAVNLAIALAQAGHRTGLLDADIYGPDIPRMLGLTRRAHAKSLDVWRRPGKGAAPEPLERHGVKVCSMQFFVGEDQPVAFTMSLAQLFLRRVLNFEWGDLDYLIVDLPPGTADLQQAFARQLGLAGVVMVVTPQDVAHLDARKTIAMYRDAGVPILGGVENMAGLVCPGCDTRIDVFATTSPERTIWADGTPRLATMPLVPAVAADAENGRPAVIADPEGAMAQAMRDLAGSVTIALGV